MLSSLDLALVVSELRPFTASVLTSTDNGFFFFFFFFFLKKPVFKIYFLSSQCLIVVTLGEKIVNQ